MVWMPLETRTWYSGPQWFTALCPIWSTHFSRHSQHGRHLVTACWEPAGRIELGLQLRGAQLTPEPLIPLSILLELASWHPQGASLVF